VNPRSTSIHHPGQAETLEARFALRVGALLSESSDTLPHDVTERLKFARGKALERAAQWRQLSQANQVVGVGQSSLALGNGPGPRWLRLVSILPLLALIAGLILIQDQNTEAQIQAAADVDVDLLGDDLPPSAYRDAGFVEFLKTPRDH
jgi:hypothetical protein